MVVMNPIEELEFEIEQGEKQKNTSYVPLFFYLTDGQKAYIRPLVNLMLPDRTAGYAKMVLHDRYDRVNKKDSIKAVCATMVSGECFYCAQAAQELSAAGKNKEALKKARQLEAANRIYLPVYLHKIQAFKDGKWADVTYEDSDGNQQPVNGLRYLELKRTSTILKDLLEYYKESDAHDITIVDFVIKRTGAGLDTEYSCIANPNGPKPFNKVVEGDFSVAGIQARVYEAAPAMTLDDTRPAEDDLDGAMDEFIDETIARNHQKKATDPFEDLGKKLRADVQKVVNSNDLDDDF